MKKPKHTVGSPWHCSLAIALALALGCGGDRALEFTVTFEKAKGLQPGQFVVYRGIRVGEVVGVELGQDRGVRVAAQIYDQHRGKVYREAIFVIERPGGFLDPSVEHQLTVKDVGSRRTPVQRGDVLEGTEGLLDEARRRASVFWEDTAESREALVLVLRELAASPQAHRMRERIEDFSNRASELAQEQLRAFRDQHLPALLEEAKRFRQQLVEEGMLQEAAEFWRRFSAWFDEVRAEAE